jgi:imidazolonepropionase-like amidohydrolase
MKTVWTSTLALCAALALTADAHAADFVLQAGRVVTVDGEVLADGGSVLVRSGRIEDVKPGYVNPWGAEVRKHEDAWLLPGFVEAHSQGGLDRGNEQAPNTPFVSVLDGLDPLSEYYVDLLRDGVTTVFVVPGDETLLGGKGLVLKPYGRTAEEMIVRRDAGLKISLAPRRNTSRMAQVAELRRALASARGQEAREVVDDPDDPARSPRQRALSALLDGRLPAVLTCDLPVDVVNAFAVMDEFGISGFVRLGENARKALPMLAERGVPVVLPDDIEPLERDAETGREERRFLAKEAKDAGVAVVIQANEGSPYGMRSLWYQAAVAVSQGLSREEAFRAVSLEPARTLGVDDRVGSITRGKDANLVLWTGDPMDPMSHVTRVWIEGDEVYDRAKDRRLKRLLEGVESSRPEGAR